MRGTILGLIVAATTLSGCMPAYRDDGMSFFPPVETRNYPHAIAARTPPGVITDSHALNTYIAAY